MSSNKKIDCVWHLDRNNELEEFLRIQCNELGKEAAQRTKSILNLESEAKLQAPIISKNPSSIDAHDQIMASILFVGPVFGEFLLSVSGKDALSIFSGALEGVPDAERELLVGEYLCEILNQSAAQRMPSLNAVFKRMTMSSPKISRGSVKYRDVKSSSSVIAFPQGQIHVAMYVDQMQTDLAEAYKDLITQLKASNLDLLRVNEKIKQQQAQLVQAEKMASLGVMAAGVAHEINNPLSFVSANLDALAEYVEITNRVIGGYRRFVGSAIQNQLESNSENAEQIKSIEQEEDIEYIVSDSQKLLSESKVGIGRINKIVQGLRKFSRAEGDEPVLSQINSEILNTLELLRNETKYKCTIETDLQPTKDLLCLPHELNQVFVNLIVNAVQSLSGTTGKLKIETRDTGPELVIKFTDNGCGMTPEVLSKLFQPFFTTKPVGKGTGLGLAISHGIVERHGGNILVESTVGLGTSFEIHLPYPGKLLSRAA